jgi:hypothetical protein
MVEHQEGQSAHIVVDRKLRFAPTTDRDDWQMPGSGGPAAENLPPRRLCEKLGLVDHADPPPSLVVPASYSTMFWLLDR